IDDIRELGQIKLDIGDLVQIYDYLDGRTNDYNVVGCRSGSISVSDALDGYVSNQSSCFYNAGIRLCAFRQSMRGLQTVLRWARDLCHIVNLTDKSTQERLSALAKICQVQIDVVCVAGDSSETSYRVGTGVCYTFVGVK
ncbi:unnamed protein product, partial [Symbiodinium sp. KB8]